MRAPLVTALDGSATRPECAGGCPLTNPADCQAGCIRAARVVPPGVCECGRGPVVAVAEGAYACCAECASDAAAAGADIMRPPAPVIDGPGQVGVDPPRDVHAPGCRCEVHRPGKLRPPRTFPTPDETGTVRVVPDADVPFDWRPYAVLAIVLAIAAVCAVTGVTR